jgi:hypothetical protein
MKGAGHDFQAIKAAEEAVEHLKQVNMQAFLVGQGG